VRSVQLGQYLPLIRWICDTVRGDVITRARRYRPRSLYIKSQQRGKIQTEQKWGSREACLEKWQLRQRNGKRRRKKKPLCDDMLLEKVQPFLLCVLLKDCPRLSAWPWKGSDVNRYPYERSMTKLDAISIPSGLVFGIRLIQIQRGRRVFLEIYFPSLSTTRRLSPSKHRVSPNIRRPLFPTAVLQTGQRLGYMEKMQKILKMLQ
jgi:hypothetical protein